MSRLEESRFSQQPVKTWRMVGCSIFYWDQAWKPEQKLRGWKRSTKAKSDKEKEEVTKDTKSKRKKKEAEDKQEAPKLREVAGNLGEKLHQTQNAKARLIASFLSASLFQIKELAG